MRIDAFTSWIDFTVQFCTGWQTIAPTVRWKIREQLVFFFASRQPDDAKQSHFRQVFEIRYVLFAESARKSDADYFRGFVLDSFTEIHDRPSFAG